MRRRGSLGHEGQLEVIDDPVHNGVVGNEGDDAHLPGALGASEWVHLIDFL